MGSSVLGRVCAAALVVLGATYAAAPPAGSHPPAAATRPSCQGHPATIVGTSDDDLIEGTSGRDVIVARGGRDTIRSGAGADVVCSGPGDDTVQTGRGNDLVDAGDGHDLVDGGRGDDDLLGGPGVDGLQQRSDQDGAIDLEDGTASGSGTDQVDGFEKVLGSGPGALHVATAADTVLVVLAGDHADLVTTPVAATATPLAVALGQGDDHYVVRQPNVTIVENQPDLSDGRDQVDIATDGATVVLDSAGGLHLASTGTGAESLEISATDSPSVYLDTGAGDDDVRVSLANGSLFVDTGPGSDRLRGDLPPTTTATLGEGDDVLESVRSRSAQPVSGGPGLDLVLGSDVRDDVSLSAGTWKWGGQTTLLNAFEDASGEGGNDVLRGSKRPNHLIGGPGNDTLSGRLGDDTLLGEGGGDLAKGDAGDDLCRAEQRLGCERPGAGGGSRALP